MKIYFDIPFVLTSITLILGGTILLDKLYLAKRRLKLNLQQPSKLVTIAHDLFSVFLIVLLIRSFVFQPYRVPSGSLMPTVMPGDFILVEQYRYGLRLPVLNTKILSLGTPKYGDLALFRYPPDPSKIFIKRVVGLPGDHVVYQDKQLFINGEKMEQKDIGVTLDQSTSPILPAILKTENLKGINHFIYQKNYNIAPEVDCIVPPNHFFVLGDNRDNSNDSRMWGMVPEQNLVGKAILIWFSWDPVHYRIRFDRMGKYLYQQKFEEQN